MPLVPEKQEAFEKSYRTLTIIWFAIFGSALLMAGIYFKGLLQTGRGSAALSQPLLVGVFSFLAFVLTVLSFGIKKWLLKKGPGNSIQNFQNGSIISWAISEAIGVYGLILGVLMGTNPYSQYFFLGSIFLLIIHFPKRSTLEEICSKPASSGL